VTLYNFLDVHLTNSTRINDFILDSGSNHTTVLSQDLIDLKVAKVWSFDIKIGGLDLGFTVETVCANLIVVIGGIPVEAVTSP
jgi:hypothetical protein